MPVEFPRGASHKPYCEIDELRFFAQDGDIRVVCRVPRATMMDVFHPEDGSKEARMTAFYAHREEIENAARRKIVAQAFAGKVWNNDPATWSIVLSAADLRKRKLGLSWR